MLSGISAERFAEIREKEGREIGEERINKLNALLIEAGRIDDLMKSATDKEFQKQLLDEFGL